MNDRWIQGFADVVTFTLLSPRKGIIMTACYLLASVYFVLILFQACLAVLAIGSSKLSFEIYSGYFSRYYIARLANSLSNALQKLEMPWKGEEMLGI